MQYHLQPKLAPSVQKVFDECGTTIESGHCNVGEKELEFFVEFLMRTVASELEEVGTSGVYETLQALGYIKE